MLILRDTMRFFSFNTYTLAEESQQSFAGEDFTTEEELLILFRAGRKKNQSCSIPAVSHSGERYCEASTDS